MCKLAFGLLLVAIAAAELGYILAVNNDDGVVFYPVTVVAAIVNLVRNSRIFYKLVKESTIALNNYCWGEN